MEDISVVSYFGKQTSKCGYCKCTKCSIAHGMHAYIMAPQDYQDLIDRGWRRSGSYCYKPNNKSTCCPCYTIKCDAVEFKLSKSHKKVLKRMNRFLRDGKKDPNENNLMHDVAEEGDGGGGGGGEGIVAEPQAPNVPIPQIDVDEIVASSAAKATTDRFNTTDSIMENPLETVPASKSQTSASFDGQKPPCKKAKQIRLEYRQAKLAAKGILEDTASKKSVHNNKEKTLADYLAESRATDKHKLKLTLVQVDSPEFKRTKTTSFLMYKRFQTAIHHDPPKTINEYLDFLQDSPLKHITTKNDPSTGYGSFHQQYWLDDKLIAVGVIDILPYCISSVYFFYDPDYSFLSLGTYGSLREIDLVQQLCRSLPALRNYYMGFYIHTCPKMRYKGKLTPSYLLCPETYTWHLLTDDMRTKLNEHKYQRFNQDASAKEAHEFRAENLDMIPLVIENRCILYKQYIQITGVDDDRDEIMEYGKLVGRICAHRIRLIKS